MKIIDNNILYIKKGQQISQEEMKKLIIMINEQSKENDTFISFDDKANAELKKGASINDDGNREKFEQTQTEDVKLKQYNPNSLKLIKSRLKFSDSLKMGASSLKNKVGKLIFTIILSFLAFTVFGVVDALSCWNRGESVYQAMEMTGQQNVVMKGMKKGEGMMALPSSAAIKQSDIDDLKAKFPEYVVKPVIGTNGYSLWIDGYNFTESRNPLYQTYISGLVSFDEAEFAKMKFEFVGSNSRLPETRDEVCISNQMMKAIVKRAVKYDDDSTITGFDMFSDAKPLLIDNDFGIDLKGANKYGGKLRVVGVVDDKTDLSKYENMNQDDLVNDWKIEEYFKNSLVRFMYIHKDVYNDKLGESYVDEYYYIYIGGKTNDYMYSSKDYMYGVNERLDEYIFNAEYYLSENSKWFWYDGWRYQKYTEAQMISIYGSGNYQPYQEMSASERKNVYASNITYVKGGFESRYQDGEFKLGKNEVLVSESYLSGRFEDWQSMIDNGLKMQFCTDYENLDSSVLDLTIVGVMNVSSEQMIFADSQAKEIRDELYGGYQLAVTRLNGTSTDAEFIQYLETWNDRGFRMSVQNSSTAMLDMMEEILIMMTSVFVWIAVGFAVFAALLLMNFISTSINYKKREIGVLRALGARGSDIFGIFL